MSPADARVAALLRDIGDLGASQRAIVDALRAAVLALGPAVTEQVKYGGLLFCVAGLPFCGVFCYAAHVGLEFSNGAALADAHAALEGRGKLRRHLKLRSLADLPAKQLPHYLQLAYADALTR